MNNKTRFVLFGAIVIGILLTAVYMVEEFYLEPMRRQQQLISNLKEVVAQLTRDIRIAEVVVLNQDMETTTLRFLEVDKNGEKIGEPHIYTIKGDIAYFDTLVIKFLDDYSPIGELPLDDAMLKPYLQDKAIIFFRRVFGEKQKPEDGFPIDPIGEAPPVYSSTSGPTSFQKQLWDEFWELATDPKLARKRGVRAAHGQAVYTKLQKGKFYVLERRLTGDLSIHPVDLPAVVR